MQISTSEEYIVTQSARAAFANVLLSAVNFQEDQCLFVTSEPVHWHFLTVLAQEAYKRGAKYVQIDAPHAEMQKARVNFSRSEHLDYVPGYRPVIHEHYVNEKWARIALAGQEDPDVFAQVDPARQGIVRKALAKSDQPLRRAIQTDAIRWVVSALPTDKWAARVFDTDPSPETTEKLWEVLVPIMRLDKPDPVAAWMEHGEALAARQRTLVELDLDSVRFTGPGTDLTVGLPENADWLGGGSTCPDGHWFLANLPTEEVFTTPDYRRTSGEVSLTRPALISGRTVTGARFVFEEGKVVDWSADGDGADVLAQMFAIDEQAKYLGELALVDANSPIYQSGLVFHNILLDENATSHIAFGSAYPAGISGGNEMSPEEFKAAGGNSSAVHSDVMLGSPEVDVTGVKRSGGTVPLMEKGLWVI